MNKSKLFPFRTSKRTNDRETASHRETNSSRVNNSVFLRISVVILVMGLTPHFGSIAVAADAKPNIVFILADELGYYQTGFMGSKVIKTPNMDRMAKDGIIMRNLLAGNATCAPTRCSLMTGKHAGHAAIRSNDGMSIRDEEVTIAEMLKQKGYATGGFGKWGIGGRGSDGVPEKNGFDLFFGYYNQAHAHSYYSPFLIRNSEEVPQAGNKGGRNGQSYSAYVIHDEAKTWIRENAERPFFAYLAYTLPHGPFAIPDDDPALDAYKGSGLKKDELLCAAMTTLLDTQIGEIQTLLQELGLEKNTLIMLSGDNGKEGLFGGNKDPDSDFQFRGDKANLYEGGVRVPFVAYWPGTIPGGQSSDHLCYFPDVMPTIAEATGTKLPADTDGISILPTLISERGAGHPQSQHDFLYWEHKGWQALRQNNWSLVKPTKSNQWELYDLADDPGQKADLAAKKPELLKRLTALAEHAHEPQRQGAYESRELDDRDKHSK